MSTFAATQTSPHMSALIFNTLAYTKKLKAAGVPEVHKLKRMQKPSLKLSKKSLQRSKILNSWKKIYEKTYDMKFKRWVIS